MNNNAFQLNSIATSSITVSAAIFSALIASTLTVDPSPKPAKVSAPKARFEVGGVSPSSVLDRSDFVHVSGLDAPEVDLRGDIVNVFEGLATKQVSLSDEAMSVLSEDRWNLYI